tara:strand:+ start:373 stop:483 length:111 start_codon:yes stop_codon:yes gene_type:complete
MWLSWEYIKEMLYDLAPWLGAIAIVILIISILGMAI